MIQVLSFILDLCLTAGCLFLSVARGGNPGVDHLSEIFRPVALAETVLVIDPAGFSRDEYDVLVSLQGIRAREGKAELYLAEGNYNRYLEAYAAANPAQAFEAFAGTLWDLVERCAAEIPGRGYVIYDGDEKNPGINMAATVAAAEGWLGVPARLAAQAEAAGLVCRRDLREMEGTAAQRQRALFKEYKDKLNPALVVHQPPDNARLRDFAIAQRAFCFYNSDTKNIAEYAREQRLCWDVFRWAKPNTSVFGVWGPAGEIPFVRKLSRASMHVLPADHLVNGSTLMGLRASDPLKQPYQNRVMEPEPGKHYAALMLSDGDNLQWLAGGAFFNGFIADRIRSGDEFPLSFTYGPLMAELFPFVAQMHYGMLQPGMQLICGVSGLGYTNLLTAPARNRAGYARLTAQAMERADLHAMQLLDGVAGKAFLNARAMRVIEAFAAQETIAGGIWYMDPDKYESGKGRFYRAGNGKPWVCNRLSFWSPDNSPATVTPEWIQSIADTINAYPRDPGRAAGYSVINIHPWSIGYEDVRRLVSLLDDDIVLLSAEELLCIMYNVQ